MKDSEKRFIEYWQKKRELGPVKFSFITGVTYGIFVLVFSKVFSWNWTFTQKDWGYAVISLVIGIMGLGPFMWWHRERKYKKLLEKSAPPKKNKKKNRYKK